VLINPQYQVRIDEPNGEFLKALSHSCFCCIYAGIALLCCHAEIIQHTFKILSINIKCQSSLYELWSSILLWVIKYCSPDRYLLKQHYNMKAWKNCSQQLSR
jgi:hypothetical protein